jgi:hypothetical protein
MDRQQQIEAAARGEGHYPVERAFDNPGDNPMIIRRYRVDTEEGALYVITRWVGNYMATCDMEIRDGERIPAEHFRQKLIGSVRAHVAGSDAP